MINDQNNCGLVVFGDRWEDGLEIEARVDQNEFWKKRLYQEISRALSLRDFHSISHLFKYCALMKSKREALMTSQNFMYLITEFLKANPRNHDLILICTEYLSKLPRSEKSTWISTKNTLQQICSRFNTENQDQHPQIEPPINHILSEGNPNELIFLFRNDPTLDLDLELISPLFTSEDWKFLIDRVDSLPTDFISWNILKQYLHILPGVNEPDKPQFIQNIHQFVFTYWPRYHLQFEVNDLIQATRNDVFSILGMV